MTSKKYTDQEVGEYLNVLENRFAGPEIRRVYGFDTIELRQKVGNTEHTLVTLHRSDVTQTDDALREEYIGIVAYLIQQCGIYGLDADFIKRMKDRKTSLEHYFDANNKDLFISLQTQRTVLAHTADVRPENKPNGKWDPALFLYPKLEGEVQ